MSSRSAKKKSKVIRSISIDENTLLQIQHLANEQKISVNAILMNIISYYVDITSHGKLFGITDIGNPNLRIILGCVDMESLKGSSPEGCRETWEQWTDLRGMDHNLNSYFQVIQTHARMGWGVVKINNNEKGHKIIFIHSLGEAWTFFLMKWLSRI